MKIDVTLDANIAGMMESEILAGERAVTGGVREVADWVKAEWRGQVVGSGLGQRLANTIRQEDYPFRGESLGAASLVYARPNRKQKAASAADVVGAFNKGALIRARDAYYLAIPTDAAGRAEGFFRRQRITPGLWEKRTGVKLRFVARRGKHALLVADDARFNKQGYARQKGGRRRKDGILTGASTVPIFVLVKQARLTKRLDLDSAARAAESRLPAAILRRWK